MAGKRKGKGGGDEGRGREREGQGKRRGQVRGGEGREGGQPPLSPQIFWPRTAPEPERILTDKADDVCTARFLLVLDDSGAGA